jgi:hypothetical protein
MITRTDYLCAEFYCNFVNGTFEIWSHDATDNINRDHIKRLPLCLIKNDNHNNFLLDHFLYTNKLSFCERWKTF